jgi:hypothetical protein
MGVFFVMSLLAVVARYWTGLTVDLYVTKFSFCDKDRCVGAAGVYRLMFATFSFFFLLAIASITSKQPGRFYRKYWLPKVLILVGLVVATWFIPHSFYNGFFLFLLRLGAGVFILFQVAALVHSIHNWHEAWLARNWLVPILVVSGLFAAGSITLCVFAFRWFTEGGGCGLHKALIALTIILVGVFTALSMSPLTRNGVLPAAVLGTYCFYLLISALLGHFDLSAIVAHGSDPCNSWGYSQSSYSPFQVVVGMLLSLFTVVYAAYSTSAAVRRSHSALSSSRRSSLTRAGDVEAGYVPPAAGTDAGSGAAASSDVMLNPSSGGTPAYTAPAPAEPRASRTAVPDDEDYGATARRRRGGGGNASDSDAGDGDGSDDDDEDEDAETSSGRARAVAISFLVLALGCLSVAATLSSWGYDAQGSPAGLETSGRISMWVKIVSQWAVSAVYIWTFIAPIVLKNREFD